MSLFTIPVRSDLPAYDFQIELDGIQYTLGFAFNTRAGHWVMDISDAGGAPILMGLKVITGWLLTARFRLAGLPPGDFFVYDSSGKNEDPTIEDFGTQKILFYADAAEVSDGQ